MLCIHIFFRSKQLQKKFPRDYKNRLKERTDFAQLNGNEIKFSVFVSGFSTILNANASMKGKILCSLEWAVRLILFYNDETKNAFAITIGHELTHKEKELHKKGLNKNDKRFQSWVAEIHADFGGAEKMVDCDRHKLVESMRYKLKQKKKDKYYESHPSWALRKCYAEYCDFNEKLIRRIAEDTCCHNEDLIDEAIHFYDEILLYPQPITTT